MSSTGLGLDLTLREVASSDLEEVLNHRRLMFHDMGHTNRMVLNSIVQSSRPVLQRFLNDGSYLGWFAISGDGRVAAGAGLIIVPWPSGPLSPERGERAYLLNVYTYPEFRRRGLARLLTQTSIEYCRRQGHKILWLHASEYGRPVYESLGFRQTNEMKLIL